MTLFTVGLVAYIIAAVIIVFVSVMLFKNDSWPKWLIDDEPHIKYDELDMYDKRPVDNNWQ